MTAAARTSRSERRRAKRAAKPKRYSYKGFDIVLVGETAPRWSTSHPTTGTFLGVFATRGAACRAVAAHYAAAGRSERRALDRKG